MHPFFLKYWSYLLTLKTEDSGLSDLALALSDVSINFLPHQMTAVGGALRALRDCNGAILADEVGLGKTIEAGIVMFKLHQEGKRKILLIAPAGLLEQWSRELEEKFHLPATVVNSRYMRRKTKPNPFINDRIVLCSYHFAANKSRYLSGLPWDLCCIDEAHNLRNSRGKISSTLRRVLLDVPKLLLSATPIQNKKDDLYSLAVFADRFFPVNAPKAEQDERWKRLLIRTLRKDSGVSFTNRLVMTRSFSLTDEEKNLYRHIETFLLQDNLHSMNSVNREMVRTLLRRLLASCPANLAGALGHLEQRLRGIQQDDAIAGSSREFEKLSVLKRTWRSNPTPTELAELAREADELKELQIIAGKVRHVSKFEALLSALKEGFERIQANGGKRKVVIFTEFLATQSFLAKQLDGVPEYKGRIVLFNGDNLNPQADKIYMAWKKKNKGSPDFKNNPNLDRKTALLSHFKHKADILIATDAAAEGLNLQLCSLVVNYDLPWNPQRLEQRIGRCHRYGQKHDVVVVNFLNLDNLAEQRLLELLTSKLQIFEQTLGHSNDPLGTHGNSHDFEHWVSDVFMNSRTEEAIQQAFDEKKRELEQPQSVLSPELASVGHLFRNTTPQFQAEVERNRIRLWQICRGVYGKSGSFNYNTLSFKTEQKLIPEEYRLSSGNYSLLPNSKRKGYRHLSLKHPVIQAMLDCQRNEPVETTVFYLRVSGLFPAGSAGCIGVTLVKCKCHYEYEKLIYTGYDQNYHSLPAETIVAMLESATVKRGRLPDIDDKLLETLTQTMIQQERDRLQELFERHINLFVERQEKWAGERINTLKTHLNSLKHDTPEFERKWEEYHNEVEGLRQKKYLTLLQARSEYAPSLTAAPVFTVFWRS